MTETRFECRLVTAPPSILPEAHEDGLPAAACDQNDLLPLRAASGDLRRECLGSSLTGAQFPQLAGLIFDTDDVFYDATVWRRWLIQLLCRMGFHADYRIFYQRWESEYLASVHRGWRERGEAFEAFLLSWGLTPGQVDEIQVASSCRRRELDDHVRALSGVCSSIRALGSAKLRLATLTNSEEPAERISTRLNSLGLEGCFLASISSFDLEHAMPEPICYQAALDALDLPAEQVAFVGHDAVELAGASELGLTTIAFNYDGLAIADLYLSQFPELLRLIPQPCRPRLAA